MDGPYSSVTGKPYIKEIRPYICIHRKPPVKMKVKWRSGFYSQGTPKIAVKPWETGGRPASVSSSQPREGMSFTDTPSATRPCNLQNCEKTDFVV